MRTRGWTKEQDQKLIEFCNSDTFVSAKDASKEIGKSIRCMYDRMNKLNIKRKSTVWTKEQDDILIELYPNKNITLEQIANIINKTDGAVKRSVKAITSRATILNLHRIADDTELIGFMLKHYKSEGMTANYIAKKFNRPVKTIYRMASDLNLTTSVCVTTKQVDYVIKNYAKENTYIMSAKIGLPEHSIRRIAYKHNIRKIKNIRGCTVSRTNIIWGKEREEFILRNYDKMTMQEMAKELSIPYSKVKNKVASMGLKEKNLKICSVGNIRFKYHTTEEKKKKLDYIIMFKQLITRGRIGDVYR